MAGLTLLVVFAVSLAVSVRLYRRDREAFLRRLPYMRVVAGTALLLLGLLTAKLVVLVLGTFLLLTGVVTVRRGRPEPI